MQNKKREVFVLQKKLVEPPTVIIPEVAHGTGEFLHKNGEDIPTPDSDTLLENDLKLVQAAYPTLEGKHSKIVRFRWWENWNGILQF